MRMPYKRNFNKYIYTNYINSYRPGYSFTAAFFLKPCCWSESGSFDWTWIRNKISDSDMDSDPAFLRLQTHFLSLLSSHFQHSVLRIRRHHKNPKGFPGSESSKSCCRSLYIKETCCHNIVSGHSHTRCSWKQTGHLRRTFFILWFFHWGTNNTTTLF
jgi:hypothetical protein